MTVLDFALQMEKDGENFYRDLIKKTTNMGMKNILTMLADDEVKHAKTIQALKEYRKPELKSTIILSTAKNIFQKMKEEKKWEDISGNQIDVYKKAQEIEVKSFSFYMEKAKEIEEPGQKKALMIVAEEEKRHYFLLDNIIKFVSRPQAWLENAEFNHLDDY